MATSVDFPKGLKKALDEELERGYYASKSDLIRDAVRRLLESKGVVQEVRLSGEARDSIEKARESNDNYTQKEIREKHNLETE